LILLSVLGGDGEDEAAAEGGQGDDNEKRASSRAARRGTAPPPPFSLSLPSFNTAIVRDRLDARGSLGKKNPALYGKAFVCCPFFGL
jgi:hypothetical protein